MRMVQPGRLVGTALLAAALTLLGSAATQAVDPALGILDVDPPRLAQRIHELVNEERALHQLEPLAWDGRLAVIAGRHSRAMADQGFFSHVNPRGEDPGERGLRAGYRCHKDYGRYYSEGLGENLFQNNLYASVREAYRHGRLINRVFAWNSPEAIARSTVRGWMLSPEHRRNILNPLYDFEGIGVAVAADDKVYITEDFC